MGTATNIVLGPASISVDAVDLGFTSGGVQVTHEFTSKDVKADQSVGTVKTFRTDETMNVKTKLLEITLENIRIAFNLPGANLVGSTLTLGYDSSCTVNEHALILVGVGLNCGVRTWTFHRCISVGSKELTFDRENETVLGVEFNCLKDPLNGNAFGTVVDA